MGGLLGVPDFACTPEMTNEAAHNTKKFKCIFREERGHFPLSENPQVFHRYRYPVLEKIVAASSQDLMKAPDRGTRRAFFGGGIVLRDPAMVGQLAPLRQASCRPSNCPRGSQKLTGRRRCNRSSPFLRPLAWGIVEHERLA